MKRFSQLREKRCWTGYKSVPSKKPYSPGSCVKESAAAAIAAATAIAKKKSGDYDSEGMRKTPYKNPDSPNRKSNDERKKEMNEDLRNWFNPNHPDGNWKRVNTKGEVVGDCAREPGEPKPKCMSQGQRASLSKKEKASAVKRKREQDPNAERQGAPINVKSKVNENMEKLDEKNKPTNPELWSRAIAQAKSKFDVYPSAYANGWASKWYKSKGGGWKTVSEAKEKTEYDYEGDMARGQLQSIINNAQRVHDMLEDNDNLPEWVQSKITLAEDYISTVSNYLMSEVDESVEEIDEEKHSVLFKTNKSEPKISVAHYDSKETAHKFLDSVKSKGGNGIVKTVKESASSRLMTMMKSKQLIKNPPKIPTPQERKAEQEKDKKTNEAVVISHKAPIGTRVADIGPGNKEYNVKTDKNYDSLSSLLKKKQPTTKSEHGPVKEDTLEEGRPSQRHPLEGHEYHKKSDEALIHIAKDAHAAAEAMKSHNTDAENKYRDQANDSATVRHFRKTSGMPTWYKKKYGHMKEDVQIDEAEGSWSKDTGWKKDDPKIPFNGPHGKIDKSGAVHSPMSRVKHLAKQAMKKQMKEDSEMDVERTNTPAKRTVSKTTMMVKDVAKKARDQKASKDKFEPEPELSTQIIRNNF
jgi:hypothetical protein